MRKITADIVFPVSADPIKDGVVVIDEKGKILEVGPNGHYPSEELEFYSGALVPGFINAHCHLELSHMKAKVPTGTGLIPFISQVVKFRESKPEEIQEAVKKADREMYKNGIVAVGDISNKPDTFSCKDKSPLRYYTFLEMFDFLQESGADGTFKQYKEVFDMLQPSNGDRKSIVPHAPYSVSKNLFKMIRERQEDQDATVSMHNQETPPENQLFFNKVGAFLDFYGSFNISLEAFRPIGKSSMHYSTANLDPDKKNLFVHNVLTTQEDIQLAQNWSKNTYWCTCPNANLYIENRLPEYLLFLEEEAKVCIGTDSLTSNWELCILEEMKTINRLQSFVPLETLIRWATLNGAEALGFDHDLGSLEKGKSPGLNLISLNENGQLHPESRVIRIA